MNPKITAHAGALNTKANTRMSIETILAEGVDILEVDVQVTRDSVLVLHHDPALRGSREMLIHHTEYKYLKAKEEDLMTLEEAMVMVKETDTWLNLDLKTNQAIGPVVVLLKKMNMVEQVVCSGCTPSMVASLKKKLPKLAVLLNVEDSLGDKNAEAYMKTVERLFNEALELKAAGLNVNYEDCSPHLVDYGAVIGVPVCVWTVDDKEAMRKMCDYRVESITTNMITTLKEVYKERN